MKRLSLFFLIVIVCISCSQLNKEQINVKDTRISLLIGKVNTNELVDTLLLEKHGVDFRINEKIPVVNGSFKYKIKTNQIQQYSLSFENDGQFIPIDFFNDKDTVFFELHPKDFDKTIVRGGSLNKLRSSYRKKLFELAYRYEDLYRKKDSVGLIKLEEETLTLYKKEIEEYSIHGYALLYELISGYQKLPYPLSSFEEWFEKYKIKYPNHYYSKLVAVTLEGKKGISNFKDFAVKTKKGEKVMAKNLILNKKLLLIDFWASWCRPCIEKGQLIKNNIKRKNWKEIQILSVLGGIKTKEEYEFVREKYNYPWKIYYELNNEFNIWSMYNIFNSGGSQFLFNSKGKLLLKNPTIHQIDSILSYHKE
jgi:thiol-disulfide isomerase/thioredoxin